MLIYIGCSLEIARYQENALRQPFASRFHGISLGGVGEELCCQLNVLRSNSSAQFCLTVHIIEQRAQTAYNSPKNPYQTTARRLLWGI